jgi:hypothetical protein
MAITIATGWDKPSEQATNGLADGLKAASEAEMP